MVEGEPIVNVHIAHIEAARKDGPRFNERMTDEERRHWKNLILLCKPHHDLIDRVHPDQYPVEVLQEWKTAKEIAAHIEPGLLASMTEEEFTELVEQAVRTAGQQRSVEATLDLGIDLGSRGVVTVPHEDFLLWLGQNQDLGLNGRTVLVATAINQGSVTAYVNSFELVARPLNPSILSQNDFPLDNPRLPYRLDSGESLNWKFSLQQRNLLGAVYTASKKTMESLFVRI